MLLRHYRAVFAINVPLHVNTVLRPFSDNALKSSKLDHWTWGVGLIFDPFSLFNDSGVNSNSISEWPNGLVNIK